MGENWEKLNSLEALDRQLGLWYICGSREEMSAKEIFQGVKPEKWWREKALW
ncbi:MAG: hypothetical protein V2G48_05060 [bacterium JZ-2024 1]